MRERFKGTGSLNTSNNEIKEIRDPILKSYLRTYVKALKNSNTIL